MYPPEVGLSAEDSVLDSWASRRARRRAGWSPTGSSARTSERDRHRSGLGRVDVQRRLEPTSCSCSGSSTLGPLARVFLGSRAGKLIRHSPVPVVVVPRGYELAAVLTAALIRTDRQVTQPSSFSNSVIGTVTTSRPRAA